MTNFNMGRLWLGKDGYYRDVNGNKIAQKGQAITGSAWRYLASKYGKDYANRVSMNTRNGNIFQNGRWRFNDVKSSKQGRTATWDEAASRVEENAKAAGARKTATGYTQRNPFNNKDTYLNQDTKNKAMKAYRARQKSQTSTKNPDEFSWSDLNPFKKGAWEGNWIVQRKTSLIPLNQFLIFGERDMLEEVKCMILFLRVRQGQNETQVLWHASMIFLEIFLELEMLFLEELLELPCSSCFHRRLREKLVIQDNIQIQVKTLTLLEVIWLQEKREYCQTILETKDLPMSILPGLGQMNSKEEILMMKLTLLWLSLELKV